MITWLQRAILKHPRSLMHLMRLLALLLLVVTLLEAATGTITHLRAVPSSATTDDWSTYLHDPARTAASNDTLLSPANAGQLTKRWSFLTGGVIASSPTVVGGTVYVGSWDGYEYALDAATGALKWKTSLGVTIAPSCGNVTYGITSAAAVQNGVVYVGGGDAYWYALDATTGTVLWKVFTGDNSATGGHYNWSSPLLYNGFAYIGVASLCDIPLVQGQLLQVDLSSHQIVNTFNAVPAGQVGGGIWTSPSLDTATNTIYVTSGTETGVQPLSQTVIALDASTLAVKDSWHLPEAQAVPDSDWGNTPILFNDAAGNPLVAAINKNGYAYAFKRTNLAAGPIWSQPLALGGVCPQCGQGSVSSGAFANGKLYLAAGNTTINGQGYQGSVRAIDPATGNYLWQHGVPSPIVPALAYSNGLLIDGAGATIEVLDASTGTRLYSYTTGNKIYGAPSVSNGQIFEGSKDGNVYAFGLPATPPPPPPPDPNCPANWTCQDIGKPSPAGSESVAGTNWNVTVGGSGISGTADHFRFLSQNVSGDTQINSQVISQQSSSTKAQAGLMVRQSLDVGAPNYAVLLAPGNKLMVQYRSAFGGTTKTVAQLTTAALPLYLEIQRVGDQFQTATSTDGVTYTLVPGSTVSIVMPNAVLEGLATSSRTSGVPDTATYSATAVGLPSTPPNPTATATPCPSGWSCAGIGNPALVGDQSLSGGTWTVMGAGASISGYADQFHYVWQSLASDGTIKARVLTQTNTNAGAEAGIMLRQSTDASAPYYAALITPGSGIHVQYRSTQGLNTLTLLSIANTLPTYLEIARSGNSYSTYSSSDGITWTLLPGSNITLNLSGSVLAGVAVTSHNGGTLNTATFDTVSTSTTVPPPPACFSGWTCADIGSPTPSGSQSLTGTTWSVQGGGTDIAGPPDQFRYVWQSLAADGSMSAHLVSQGNTNPWAKAGVMLRQSTDPGAGYYAVLVTPGNGIVVQYRPSQGANYVKLVQVTGTVPTYLRVARSGTTFSAYTSSDGSTWTLLPGSSITLNLSGSLLAGVAVTSHNKIALSTVTLDSVSVA